MGSDPEWIVGMDVPGEAIYRTFFLGLKSTEHAVPDDEHTGVVLVQVLQIGCMMHTVMGGSIENKLNGAGQFADSLRMDPELVNKADGLHGHHHRRMEAKEGHPDPEKEGAGEVAGPVLPQGGGQVIFLRRMMYYMGSPEEADVMAEAVEPVIGEVIGKKAENPNPPLSRIEGEEPESVNESVYEIDNAFRDQTDGYVAQPHRDAAERIFRFIKMAVIPRGEDDFRKQQQYKTRNGKVDEIGHGQ